MGQKMPQAEPDEQAAFEQLTILIHQLHEQWVIYRELFSHTQARVDHLNRRTGFVFYHINAALSDSIFLGIAKAIDGDKRTLSLRRAIASLPDAPPNSTKEKRKQFHDRRHALLARHDEVLKVCQLIIEHRDKRIAHHEREVALGEKVLPPVPDNVMQDAMTAIADLFHDIVVERDGVGVGFYGAEIDLEPVCRMLIYVLRAGNIYLDEKETEYQQLLKRAASGEIVENLSERLSDLRKWFREE